MSKISLRRENEVQEVISHVSNLNELVGKREDPRRSMEGPRENQRAFFSQQPMEAHICVFRY